jgi:hypothetical protein
MVVIASGAFAISADSWIKLAELAGFTASLQVTEKVVLRLAWVLPVVVDAYTALTTWLYFGARVGSELRKYAGWSAFVAAALSVVAQGALHGLTAADINVQQVWPLVVAVGGVPPVLLGSVIHLLATYLADHRQTTQPAEKPKATYSPRAVDTQRSRPAASRTIEPQRGAPKSITSAAPQPRSVSPEPAPVPQRLAAVRDDDAPEAPQASDAQIADAIRAHVLESHRAGVDPGQREMVRLVREATGLSVGQKRCVRIAKTITDSSESTDDKEDSPERHQYASVTA